MTLDDAIVAFGQLSSDDFDSLELDVRDYKRLVNWLTELKLARESAFSDIGLAARAVSENNQLKDENAKLRELCEDMNKVAHMFCEAWEGSCSKEAEGMSLHAVCPIGDTSELCVFGKLHDRMRELGIEVKE